MSRVINKAGLDLIKHYEGFGADAYLCPAGVWTIGYGHTLGVKRGQKITKKKAEQLLREDLSEMETGVERCISVPLNDNQFASLVSFSFNLGLGNLKSITLKKKLNGGDYECVPSEMAKWIKSKGTLSGLVRRRASEGELFLLPDGDKASDEVLPMPQVVESTDESIRDRVAGQYLIDNVVLKRGSVDDKGDERYMGLSQNVPDRYVYDLQNDLTSLGFTEVGTPDGAYGSDTKAAVQAYQKLVGIGINVEVDRGTKDAIMQWLEQGHTRNTPLSEEENDSANLSDGVKLISPRVPHFSQGDARWADRMLGRGSSIRKEGCALSCIAMILNHYGRNTTPKVLDTYLDAHNGYAGNSVKWDVAGRCGETDEGVKLKYGRLNGSRKKVTDTITQRVEKNLPTMVRVDYGIDANLTYNHFVVCVGLTGEGEFIMNDPATREGDGYTNGGNQNIIQRTTRKNGYAIVKIDYYDPV